MNSPPLGTGQPPGHTPTDSRRVAAPVIDGQVHVWERRPNAATDPLAFTPSDLLRAMDHAGVARAVLVPPSWQGDANDTALAAARRYPDRFGVMGRIALDDPENGADLVRQWRGTPGALGFRLTLSAGSDATRTDGRSWLDGGTSDWFWPVAAQHGVPVMLYCTGLLPRIAEIAQQYPTLRIVVDHLGLPPDLPDDDEVGRALHALKPMAAYPNVAVKAGPVTSYTTQPFPYPAFARHLSCVVDWFGADRVFWASDLTRLTCPYAQLVDFYRRAVPLGEDDRRLVLGQGIADWLGWNGAA